ncbi:retrovirus-related pol polyprotein LINE-1 [Tanacetum coccineum]
MRRIVIFNSVLHVSSSLNRCLWGDNIWERKSGSVWLRRRRLKLAGIFYGDGGSLLLFSSSSRSSLVSLLIEPSVYNGNLRSCFPGRGGLGGSRETRRDNRVAAFRRIRVGSWNVGSLTGKRLELVDALARHKVDIACFQETKWKGSSNIEGNGYKLWYSGSPTAKNRVGVILKACLKDKVVHVNRCSRKEDLLGFSRQGREGVPDGPTTDSRGRLEWPYRGGDRGIHGCPWRLREGGEYLAENLVEEPYWGRNRDTAKETLGVAIGTSKTHMARRESWWLCEEVCWELLSCREDNEEERLRAHERYKESKRLAKKVIAQAKEKAYEDLYKKLDSKEGANDIFRIAKARERRRMDLGDICFIKDEEGRTITDEEEIKKRWGEYFSSLFNAREREGLEEGGGPNRQPHLERYYSRINQTEVRTALHKMGRNKAVGPDQIPIEAWRSLGDEGIFWLTSLFNKIFTSTKMPEE